VVGHHQVRGGEERRGIAGLDEAHPIGLLPLKRRESRAPVDAAVIPRIRIQRPIVQFDHDVEPGADERFDDLLAGEVE
jgi:hypothetical protein